MAGGREWEAWEDRMVREAPRGTLRAVARELGRTYRAVQQWRYKLAGNRGRCRPWTPEEDALLMAARPVARVDTRAFAGRTPIQLAARALGRSMASVMTRRKLLRRTAQQ